MTLEKLIGTHTVKPNTIHQSVDITISKERDGLGSAFRIEIPSQGINTVVKDYFLQPDASQMTGDAIYRKLEMSRLMGYLDESIKYHPSTKGQPTVEISLGQAEYGQFGLYFPDTDGVEFFGYFIPESES